MTYERHQAAARARLLQSDLRRAGPGSVTWKVNREAIVVAGWGRAILMQLAHPSIAAGVADHSAFRASLLSRFARLRSTVGAMLSLTFGETEEAVAAAARIHTIHDRVRGRMNDGAGYSAHDPVLQRWVHATLVESVPMAYERLAGPLTPRERDAYCREAAAMEPLMGIPSGWLPRTTAELDIYMRQILTSGDLDVTDNGRTLARAVLFPPGWRAMWPVFRAIQVLTLGSLPPAIRDAYGFAWNERDARACERWTTALRAARRVLPPPAREWPMARRRDSGKCGLIQMPESVANRDSISLP